MTVYYGCLMCGFVIDWILAYIRVKMHNFHWVSKNYIFFKDHDHFGLGHKVQILNIKRGIEWCLFVALHSNSELKHQGNPTGHTGWIVLIFLPEDWHTKEMRWNWFASFLLIFYFKTRFPFEYNFPFSLANVIKLTYYKQIYLYLVGKTISLSLQRITLMSTSGRSIHFLLGSSLMLLFLVFEKNRYTIYY